MCIHQAVVLAKKNDTFPNNHSMLTVTPYFRSQTWPNQGDEDLSLFIQMQSEQGEVFTVPWVTNSS